MQASLARQPAQSAAENPREIAIESISRAAAAVAVSAGAPTDWRLCQILTAIELFDQDWYDLAIAQARHAELPIEAIPADELAVKCPQPFGAVLHEVRRLRDTMARPDSRAATFALAMVPTG